MTNVIICASFSGTITHLFKSSCGGRKDVRLDTTSLTNGIMCGLVAVSAGANCMETGATAALGVMVGFAYIFGNNLLKKMQIDDPLEVT